LERIMEQQSAWVEAPFSTAAEASDNFIRASVKKVTEFYARTLFQTGIYKDLPVLAASPLEPLALDETQLKLLLSGKLQVLTDGPLHIGDQLMVELSAEGEAEPIKTLAVVVKRISDRWEGFHASAIRIVGVTSSLAK
jgi:hypothetical protein